MYSCSWLGYRKTTKTSLLPCLRIWSYINVDLSVPRYLQPTVIDEHLLQKIVIQKATVHVLRRRPS